MSSRKYQMKKEEPKYVNMKGKTVGNNNAVGGKKPVYTSMQTDFKLMMLLQEQCSVKKILSAVLSGRCGT